MTSLATVAILFAVALGGITSVVNGSDSNGWSKKSERTVVVGCLTQLVWKYDADYTDIITVAKNGVVVATLSATKEQDPGNEKFVLEKTLVRERSEITLTIHNVTTEDSGVYACNLEKLDLQKHIQLFVKDFQWKNDIQPISVELGKDLTMMWEYDIVSENRNIFVYTADRAAPDDEETLGMWIGDAFMDNKGLDRISLVKSTSEDESTERISLTLLNITFDDFRFMYKIRLDLTMDQNTCSKHPLPVTLTEDVGFVWTSTTDSVVTPLGHNAEIIWKFETAKPPTKIVFTRENKTSNTVTAVGTWTMENGFIVNLTSGPEFSRRYAGQTVTSSHPSVYVPAPTTAIISTEDNNSTNVTSAVGNDVNSTNSTSVGDLEPAELRNTESATAEEVENSTSAVRKVQGEEIILRLPRVTESDLDLVYNCHVFSGPWFDTKQGIQLLLGEEEIAKSSSYNKDPIILFVSLAATVVLLVVIITICALMIKTVTKRRGLVTKELKSGSSTSSNSPRSTRYPYKPMTAINGNFSSYLRTSETQSTPLVNGTARQYSNEHIDWIGETRDKDL